MSKIIKFQPDERNVQLQTMGDLTAAIRHAHAQIELQRMDLRTAGAWLVSTPANPAAAKINLGHVRNNRSKIISQIRACRSGLLNLQCAALVAWQENGEVGGPIWDAVAAWTATAAPARLLEAVGAAMMTLPDAPPLQFAKYEEEEGLDPLFPEAVRLAEDPAFLETAAELFDLSA